MPEGSQSITLGLFPRGVNYSRPADELGLDELYEMENVHLGQSGEADKRNGSVNINSSALNSGATVTALGNMRFSASSEATFAVIGNKFYEDVGGTPTDRSGAATITAGDDKTWKFVNADGTLIGHNGVSGDTLLKWAAAGGNVATWDVDSRFTTCEWVEWWDRRAWAGNLSSGVNRVWYSDTDAIETWGANNFFTFDYDVTAIKRWIKGLVVHTESTITLLMPTGDATTPYRKINVVLDERDGFGGSICGRAVVNIPGIGQSVVRRDGIYAFNGSEELVHLSAKLDGVRYWDSINADRLSEAFALHYPLRSEIWFWLPHGSGQTKMNHVMILNYRLSRLMGEPVWYGPDVDLTRNCAGLIDDKPHFGGFDGFVYKHDQGTVDDDGTTDNAIDAFAITGWPPPLGGDVDVEWKSARIFHAVSGTHALEVQQQSPDAVSETSTVVLGGSFDAIETAFTIEQSAIAGDDVVTYSDITLFGKSPFMGMKFKNGNASQAFTVRKVIMGFDAGGRKRRDVSGVKV